MYVASKLDEDFIQSFFTRRLQWLVHEYTWDNDIGHRKDKQSAETERIEKVVKPNLISIVSLIKSVSSEYKLVTSSKYGYFYTNDLDAIKNIRSANFLARVKYTEAIIDRPLDTIKVKTSKFSHRSYFKSIKLSSAEKNSLRNFINNQKEFVKPSKPLLDWLNETDYHRLADYFYVDHYGEQWLLLLSLSCSSVIRKTVGIITD